MDIYFVGYLKSPFIKQDFELLNESHRVISFDLSTHATSFKQIFRYLISTVLEWNNIRRSAIVWIWFADYPALPFIVLAKIFRKPIVVNVGGWEVYAAPDIGYGNQLNPIRGWVTRWILRNATRCITMSNAYKSIITSIEPKANIVVIPGWVDTKLCNTPLPKKHGVITALCTYKFTHILKGMPIFEAATVGIDAQVIENIPRERLLAMFKSAKVYCQPSYTESFGMSLLEAMACGCVPVVSQRDALPEVVGTVGFVVPYGDVERTRRAIIRALQLDGSVVNMVRARARTFTRERKENAVITLLEEVCNH